MRMSLALVLSAIAVVALALVSARPGFAANADHRLAFPWTFNQTAYITQGYARELRRRLADLARRLLV